METKINRWLILIASTAVLLCTGAVYAFSVFAGPLSQLKGWSMEEIMLAFTINAAVGPITMILGGLLTDRGAARWVIAGGGVLFGAGFFLTGLVNSPHAVPDLWSLCWFRARLCLFGLFKQYDSAIPR